MDSNNSMALSTLLWKFKDCSYSNIDAKIYCDKLKTILQPKWSSEMFELFYNTFDGGGKIDDVAGFEGGYIGLSKGKLRYFEGGGGSGDDGDGNGSSDDDGGGGGGECSGICFGGCGGCFGGCSVSCNCGAGGGGGSN